MYLSSVCSQFLSQSSKTLGISLVKGVFCYANEMIQGRPLDSFRMGAGHQNDQPCGQRVGT